LFSVVCVKGLSLRSLWEGLNAASKTDILQKD
jgi:hypothetical protein